MAAPAAADDEEYEICNDDGFVYKRRRGLYPDLAPTSVQAAGPDPEAVLRRRHRRALRRLLVKRRRELACWVDLDEKDRAQQTAPVPPTPRASPAAAAAADQPASSFLDDIHAHLEVREEIVKKLTSLCDEFEALHVAHIASWPVWGDPKELASLQSPGTPDYLNEAFQSLDSIQEDNIAIDPGDDDGFQEAAGVSPTAIQMRKEHGEATTEGLGHDPSTLSENRKKKMVASPHGSKSAKKPKRFRQSTSPNPVSSRLRHTANTAVAAKIRNQEAKS